MKNAQYSNFEKVVKIIWHWGLEPRTNQKPNTYY
jgi:hypothetical protein